MEARGTRDKRSKYLRTCFKAECKGFTLSIGLLRQVLTGVWLLEVGNGAPEPEKWRQRPSNEVLAC